MKEFERSPKRQRIELAAGSILGLLALLRESFIISFFHSDVHFFYDRMNAPAGRQQSCGVRSLAMWLTVRRSWVRIPAAIDFVFATSFSLFLRLLG